MTKKYNILPRKPIHGEVIYLPCFTKAGGYIRTEWHQGYTNYCNSETVLFKDWQSARAATKFLLKYIKDSPKRFSYLKRDHIGPVYILKMGHLDRTFHQHSFRDYSDIEYLMESGLVYVTEKEVLEAKKELERTLYFEVLKFNRGFVFNLRHPLEDKIFYFPDPYSGRVKTIKFSSDNPDHKRFREQNLLFTDLKAAEEVLQTWLDLPVLNNNSQLKED